jgi:hypothetical protein
MKKRYFFKSVRIQRDYSDCSFIMDLIRVKNSVKYCNRKGALRFVLDPSHMQSIAETIHFYRNNQIKTVHLHVIDCLKDPNIKVSS